MDNQPVYDNHGYPICKGDLLRTYHFGRGRGTRYLYHVAVDVDGVLIAFPTCYLEPTRANGEGRCPVSIMGHTEIISGYGPAPILDYRDRPKRGTENVE